MQSVTAIVTRKPSSEPLTMRVLFGPDDVDIPEGDEVTYQVQQDPSGMITLTPETGP